MDIYRAFINQPSASQPLHKYHARYCIALDDGNRFIRIYFTEGDTHSLIADRLCIDKVKLSSVG